MHKLIIGSIVALGLASTSAMAQSTWSGGHARADRHGASAGGGSGSEYRQDRGRRGGDRNSERAQRAPENSASTYGAGSIYTDRNRASGAVAAGGRASGVGPQSASSSIDAYGQTDRNGSSGEVYGDSSATSGE